MLRKIQQLCMNYSVYKFVQFFFDFLSRENINYLILRNYESLPYKVSGTDIDILIDNSFNSKVRYKLVESVHLTNYKLWKDYRKNFGLFQMAFVPNQINNPYEVVRIDFIENRCTWLGMEIIENKKLWENVIIHNDLPCLAEPISNALSVLNGSLYAGYVKEMFYDKYDSLDLKGQDLVAYYLGSALKESQENIKEEIKSRKISKTRNRLIKAQGINVIRILSGGISWLYTLFSRLIYPPGDFIVLIGPDGSGKSTLANLMNVKCKRMYAGIDYFHLFPKISLFRLFDKISYSRWENRQREKIPEWKMRGRKFGFIPSLIRLFYLSLRFLIGYFSVYYQLMKGHLVISDRWCYDIMIDPGSKGIKLSVNIRQFFMRLIPKPDKIIALIGDPEKIANRKPELNVPTIVKQLNIMKSLFSGRSNIKFVNTDISPDKSFQEALRFIVK